jgi:hypothetical protein
MSTGFHLTDKSLASICETLNDILLIKFHNLTINNNEFGTNLISETTIQTITLNFL